MLGFDNGAANDLAQSGLLSKELCNILATGAIQRPLVFPDVDGPCVMLASIKGGKTLSDLAQEPHPEPRRS